MVPRMSLLAMRFFYWEEIYMTSIKAIKEKSLKLLQETKNLENLEDLRVEILGKKGLVNGLMQQMRKLDQSERPIFGAKVNELKSELESIIKEKLAE